MAADYARDIVERVYEACLRPELWPQLLATTSERLGLFGGVLIVDTPGGVRWSADARMRPIMQAFVDGGWHRNNTRMAGRIRSNKSGFVDEFDLYPKDRLVNEPVYVRHFRPSKLGWSVSTLIEGPNRENLVVDFEQTLQNGPVSQKVKGILDGLRPHFARSMSLSASFAQRMNAQPADLLQMLDLPAFVVDEAGCVVAANAAVDGLDPVVSIGAEDKLLFADQSVQDQFLQAVKARNCAHLIPRFVVAAPARRCGGYVAQILPLIRSALDVFSRGAAIVYFTKVGQPAPPSTKILAALFDISPSESEVARGLLAGASARKIAQMRGVSVETVRMQVKSVLAKAGVGRQVELAVLFSTLILPGQSRS